MRPLEYVFSVRNEDFWKVFTVLGIKIRLGNGKYFNKFFQKIIRKSFINSLNFLLDFWGVKNNINLNADYAALIKNMDEKSVENVNLTLGLFIIHDKNSAKAFLKNLRRQILSSRKFRKEYSKSIENIGAEKYSYNGYMLPLNHFEPSVFNYKHSINELVRLDKIRQKDIIDVGGFIGDSALVFSDYTDKKIYSFEPSKENFELMKKTIELNNLTNVVPVNCALGDNVAEKLYINGDGSTVTVASPPSSKSFAGAVIEATTLDDFVRKNNIEVGLIKVDIEGYEQHFLKGAEQTIKTQKPALLISIYHNIDDYLHIKPMIESWNLGYKFKIRKPEESLFLETLLIAEIED